VAATNYPLYDTRRNVTGSDATVRQIVPPGSSAGAIGILVGISPFVAALGVGVLFGAAVFLLERKTTISYDALIGVLFTGGLALGVLLISLKRGYQPELLSFLFGSILSVSSQDLMIMVVFSVVVFLVLLNRLRQVTLLALDQTAPGCMEYVQKAWTCCYVPRSQAASLRKSSSAPR